MRRMRVIYFITILFVVIIGLLSRQVTAVPLFIGDVLWATMLYFIARFLFINRSLKFSVLIGLLFCYLIEFTQLYKAPWIDNLRRTLFGRLVLGDTFLWGDLLSYAFGIAIGVFFDILLRRNNTYKFSKPS